MQKVKLVLSILVICCMVAGMGLLIGCGDGSDSNGEGEGAETDNNGDNGDGNGSDDGDGDGNGSDNDDGDSDDDPQTSLEQWAAYAFEQLVEPKSGDSGKVTSFTMEETYDDDGDVKKFRIEGEYLGKETTEVKTNKAVSTVNPPDFTEETVISNVECYKVKHNVTVLQDDTGESHPDWAETTVWIPTGDLETSTQYFWIYPRSEYIDSDGNSGSWSYLLTDEMQDEMENPPEGTIVLYTPYVDGEFYGFDEWALHGLYGWAWWWFAAFAEGGEQYLKDGSWNWGAGGVTHTYSCSPTTETIGDHSFDAWNISITWSYQGEEMIYNATLSHDLPIPIFLKVGGSGGDSSGYFEYELTDVSLE